MRRRRSNITIVVEEAIRWVKKYTPTASASGTSTTGTASGSPTGHYSEQLHEDLSIRRSIQTRLPDAGIAKVEIERNANQVTVSIHTARPGIVIGRGGQRVDELRNGLEKVTGRRRYA